MKKILFLYRYGILGGVCTQIYQRLVNFNDEDTEIHCGFRSDHGASELFDGICHIHFGITASNVVDLVEEYRFDIVVIIDTPEYIDSLKKINDKPFLVLEVHTSIKNNLEYLRELERGDIDEIITVSEYMVDEIINYIEYDIRRDNIHRMSNLIDIKPFNKEVLHTDGKRPLLWVGKIDDHKNWREFIDIVEKVSHNLKDFEFWILGGHTCDKKTAQDLFDYVNKKNVINKFKWFDKVPYSEMHLVYKTVANRSGLSIVTSKGESFGMSVLESLMSGCPVISSNVGAINEITKNTDFLKLYDLGDLDSASKLVIQSINYNSEDFQDEVIKLKQEYDAGVKSKDYWALLESFID